MAQDPTPPLTSARTEALAAIPFEAAPSPAYIVHTGLLEENCRLLAEVGAHSGAKILLALKGFACHATFPLIRRHLSGTTSSGLQEALLARDYFGGEVHVYCPAYKLAELERLKTFAHSLVFNSPGQLARALPMLGRSSRPQIGLRVNPECSTGATPLYDPCAPESRLGTTRTTLDTALNELPADTLDALDGLHFHALCEQDADALEHTAEAFEKRFGDLIPGLQWLNFGGGHHITRPGYDTERLGRIVRRFRRRYDVDFYLEPGEAVALHTGVLVVTILDIHRAANRRIAIIDASATCHMPDVLEMPYRPTILGADEPGRKAYPYRIGGLSCLAGDVVGDYAFDAPLEVGQRLVFLDMAHYTMVKSTTFNGVPHPAIATFHPQEGLKVVRRFGYEDYRTRLS